MTPERWQEIDGLLNEALDVPATERGEFLSGRCADDDDLKQEVESLLEAREQSETFIETPAVRIVAEKLAGDSGLFPNLTGRSLDNYRVKELIGEGGMGEVYRAFDEKLKRDVAIKILPGRFKASDERVGRFEREAQAISSLNHPNIVTIYDVGVFEDINYIATEFIEGKTLRHFIKSGIDLNQAISIIMQCCDALAAAHEAGIIHRDIKPENIVIRPDGYVKILDFGLAKLTQEPSDVSVDPSQTAEGIIIGTPAYMSPSQILGEQPDHRTDLWSIGVILFELITSVNPFKQKTKQETFKAILNSSPESGGTFDPAAPELLEQVLSKALEKDLEMRYQSAADLKADLKRVKREIDSSVSFSGVSGSSGFARRATQGRNRLVFGILCAVVISIGIGTFYFYFRSNTSAKGADWTNATSTPLTSQSGGEYFPSLAPDGESFAFAAEIDGNYDIFLKRVGGTREINLTENSPDDDTQPVFSPDGKQIAFRSERNGGGVFVMEETGENPRRVCDFGFHPTWSPDGKHLAVSESGFIRPYTREDSSIWIVDAETGDKRKLVSNYSYQPSWSPNGKRIAYWSIGVKTSKREVKTISVDGRDPVVIPNPASANWNPVWSPDGKFLYYASSRSGNMAFWRVPIDESTGKPLGEAEIVSTPGKFNGHLSFSRDGKRFVYVQMNNKSNLRGVEFDPVGGKTKGEPFWITNVDQEIQRPRLSPDGSKFVVNVARLTQDDIVVFDRDGKNWRDITNDEFFDRYPNWSNDGQKIGFMSDRSGIHQIWMINSDGSNLQQITNNNESTSWPIWSHNSNSFAFRINRRHFVLDAPGTSKSKQHELNTVAEFKYHDWDWSPDGKTIAGRWTDDSGVSGTGVYSLDSATYKKLWTGPGSFPVWLPDSKRLFVALRGKLNLFDTELGTFYEIPSLPETNARAVGISRDGSLLFYTVEYDESNIWLLDLK